MIATRPTVPQRCNILRPRDRTLPFQHQTGQTRYRQTAGDTPVRMKWVRLAASRCGSMREACKDTPRSAAIWAANGRVAASACLLGGGCELDCEVAPDVQPSPPKTLPPHDVTPCIAPEYSRGGSADAARGVPGLLKNGRSFFKFCTHDPRVMAGDPTQHEFSISPTVRWPN
jgi:hypothetical protein